MKTNALLAIIAVMLFSCSKEDDNCLEKQNQINTYYDQKIEYVKNNPGPDGIDYRQIELLNQERNKKLAEACN